MNNTDPIKNRVNSGVREGYFRLFITNCLYNLLKYTICSSHQKCKPDADSFASLVTTYRSLATSYYTMFYFLFLIDFMFHWYWFVYRIVISQLPLFSILFNLCQPIHARNNKTKIHTRNNETKKHASFKLTFRNID